MNFSAERGSISALVLGLVTSFMLCAGLVVDGGRVVARYLESADIAENAARSGSQELRSLRSGEPTIDPPRATRAAHRYLESQGVTGLVSIEGNSVVVSVEQNVRFSLLSLIGLSAKEIAVTRSAEPVIQ
jgi:Flp pilus assembly protein TadG